MVPGLRGFSDVTLGRPRAQFRIPAPKQPSKPPAVRRLCHQRLHWPDSADVWDFGLAPAG